jgi:hypothetical protein
MAPEEARILAAKAARETTVNVARRGEWGTVRNSAFRYLDAAFAERSPGLVFLKVDRWWDPIRSDPRFLAAVRKVGLPAAGHY